MASHTPLFVLCCSTLVLLASSVGSKDNFEPSCQSDNDYGWPRFQSQEELKASPWSSYFMDVYGEIPSKYPVCIFDFEFIDKEAYHRANITGHKLVPASQVKAGDLFKLADAPMKLGWGDILGYGIFHESWKPLPEDTWIEIGHTAFPTEMKGFWAFRLRGSGIWVNTGRTIVFPESILGKGNMPHQAAYDFFAQNCSINSPNSYSNWPQVESDVFGFCAREKGYDSIQFKPSPQEKPWGEFGFTGLTEMVIVNIDGKYNCGTKEESKTPLHEGWMASRQCNCKNHVLPDSCGVVTANYSYSGTHPRLCKLQQGPPYWNRWKSCNPSTCPTTKCGFRRRNDSVVKTAVGDIADKEAVII